MDATNGLSATGRRVRVAATAAVLAATLAGTFWGLNDHFPFGPMGMYSTRTDPNGTVGEVRVEGVSADGRATSIPYSQFGLRRAEIEGQVYRFIDDPSLLRHLYAALERSESAEDFVALRLVKRDYRLRNARAVSFEDRVLATWSSS